MSTQGPSFAGTVSQISTNDGGNVWSNLNNIKANDGLFASMPFESTFFSAGNSLVTTNFGFSVPTTATINGITVAINRRQDNTSTQDSGIQLLKASTVVGTNKSTGASWPSTATTITFGSVSDLWGTTWTPAEVNGSGFGFQLDCVGNSFAGSQANVDYITITITYTPAAGTNLGRMFAMF